MIYECILSFEFVMTLRKTPKFILSIFICYLASLVGSLFTMPALDAWYLGLAKPDLTPPDWVFGPVWFVLFTFMGIALFLVWSKKEENEVVPVALGIFAAQLLLNVLWSLMFFGLQSPAVGFVVIVALWFMILFTILFFYRISRFAGLVLVPYILWVSFAMYLNFWIYWLN